MDKLSGWLQRQCHALGLVHPTPVQENCMQPLLEGRDCIACAKTGSGKTAAFALPMLQALGKDPYGIYAIVLTPTRCALCAILNVGLQVGWEGGEGGCLGETRGQLGF
jgi:superfamily II DNA/RNA helicase